MSDNKNEKQPYSDDVMNFLKEDCEAGDYAMLTVMVNRKSMRSFLEHLNQFYGRAGVFEQGTDKGAVVGKDEKSKLSLVDKKDDDKLQ